MPWTPSIIGRRTLPELPLSAQVSRPRFLCPTNQMLMCTAKPLARAAHACIDFHSVLTADDRHPSPELGGLKERQGWCSRQCKLMKKKWFSLSKQTTFRCRRGAVDCRMKKFCCARSVTQPESQVKIDAKRLLEHCKSTSIDPASIRSEEVQRPAANCCASSNQQGCDQKN